MAILPPRCKYSALLPLTVCTILFVYSFVMVNDKRVREDSSFVINTLKLGNETKHMDVLKASGKSRVDGTKLNSQRKANGTQSALLTRPITVPVNYYKEKSVTRKLMLPDMDRNKPNINNPSIIKNLKFPDIKRNKCPPKFTFSSDKFSHFGIIDQKSQYSVSGNKLAKDKYKDIVILTPVSNSVAHLQYYFQLICWLSYPHELISIALGEDSSQDSTYKTALEYAKELAPYFKRISVYHLDNNKADNKPQGVTHKHDQNFQLLRRSHMAKSRNKLLLNGIGDADSVLWVDVDVKYYPKDIIQHLLSEEKDIVVPNCMWATGTRITPYDFNNWQETPQSIAKMKTLNETQLRVEGYGKDINRKFLHTMTKEGRIVPLDGVGGCVLMVKAGCHRQGLIFPTFVFKNQIETEGLAKMAKTMGLGVYGMPSLTVVHTYT